MFEIFEHLPYATNPISYKLVIGPWFYVSVSLDEIVRQVTKGVVFVLTMAVRRGSR